MVSCLVLIWRLAAAYLSLKDPPDFKWISILLGNRKSSVSGAFHPLTPRYYRLICQIYLTAFSYRFNGRFDLRGLVPPPLIMDVARSKPVPEKVVRRGMLRQFSNQVAISSAYDSTPRPAPNRAIAWRVQQQRSIRPRR
jgi:hypothetical protein